MSQALRAAIVEEQERLDRLPLGELGALLSATSRQLTAAVERGDAITATILRLYRGQVLAAMHPLNDSIRREQ